MSPFSTPAGPCSAALSAGAEMRLALGVAVFSGMLGVTFFGLFFTPVFYTVIRRWIGGKKPTPAQVAGAPVPESLREGDGALSGVIAADKSTHIRAMDRKPLE